MADYPRKVTLMRHDGHGPELACRPALGDVFMCELLEPEPEPVTSSWPARLTSETSEEGLVTEIPPAAIMAAAIAIERELLSGKDYSMAQDSDEALARAALEAAAPLLVEAATQAITGLREQASDPRFDDDQWNSGYDAAMEDALRVLAAVWADESAHHYHDGRQCKCPWPG